MLLRQTETGLRFFFKLVSVLDETLVNGKYERLIRSGGFLCTLQGRSGQGSGVIAQTANGLGCLSTAQSCWTICSD